MSNVLITLPEHDDTVFYCTEWSERILIPALERNRLNPILLRREKVNRKNVTSVILNQNPKLICFNGHGNEDEVDGHDNETLIKVGENEDVLANSIVHALSCASSSKLGPSSVEKGCIAYLGYENDFIFLQDTNKSALPLQDEVAKPFFDSALTLPLNLVNGKTVRESLIKTRDTYKYWILYYRRYSEQLPEASQNLSALIWNQMSLSFHGNLEAKV